MTEPERSPCPECGKEVTWTQAGKPRSHKCEPKPAPPATAGGITAEHVIAKFIETRDEIAARQKALDIELEELKAFQQKRIDWLKTQMDKLGVDNLGKKEIGKAFIVFKDSASVKDGEAFKAWVHDDWEGRNFFLNNAVNKTAVKQRLEDGEPPPPGVNYTKIKDVQVRRS